MTKLVLLPFVLAFATALPLAEDQTAEWDVGLRLVVVSQAQEGMADKARNLARRISFYNRGNHAEWIPTAFGGYTSEFKTLYQFYDFPDMSALERASEVWESEEGLVALSEEHAQYFDAERGEVHCLLPVTRIQPAREDRSFRWMRINRATFGNYASAVDHARRVAEYVNANYDETRFEVYMAYFDGLGEIHWTADHASAEAWRATRARLWADPNYVDLMSEAASLYVDGSWEEELAWGL